MPAVATVLPSRSAGSLDARLGQRDQRGQRAVDEGRDGDDVEALVAREHDLGLVGDRQVDLSGRDLLDRCRGIGGHPRRDVKAGILEVAALERRVDPGVIGVDEEVEREVERLADAAPVLLALAAGGRERQQAQASGSAAAPRDRVGPSSSFRFTRALAILPPGNPPLEQAYQGEQADRQRREDRHRGEQPRHQQLRGRAASGVRGR